jgi:hypothetical protein
MMHMHVVPYIDGDKQDDNHVRVANHHCLGLTGSTVWIDFERREVRCCSRPHGQKHRDHNASILIHLVPRKVYRHRMKCEHVSHFAVLNYIDKVSGQSSMVMEFYHDIDDPSPVPRNLMLAKLKKLVRKGYIKPPLNRRPRREMEGSYSLTDKGRSYLEAHHG